MRRMLLLGGLMIGMLLATSSAAFAVHGSNDDAEQLIRTGWKEAMGSSKGCQYCHAQQTEHTSGPHGGYQATTDKCLACHSVHKAKNASLLPGETVTDTCNFCHDLTQTEVAPYYSKYATTETPIRSAHQVEGLDEIVTEGLGNWDGSIEIPGGDSTSGDIKNLDTSKQGKISSAKFTCDSCHTPHAIEDSTVEPYLGESRLKFSINAAGDAGRFWLTDRLLKANLNGSTTFPYKKYGSDWCAGCHMGRYNNGEIHNHPVAMGGMVPDGVTAADPNDALAYQFLDYLSAADFDNGATKEWLINNAKDSDGQYNTFYWAKDGSSAYNSSTGVVDLGAGFGSGPRYLKKDPRSNRHYAMTLGDPVDPVDPNKARPDGYTSISNYPDGPSCQQCHGNARDVEKAFSIGLNDGSLITTFPHVSKNRALIVEDGDDFCTNCHGLDNLP